MRTRPYLFVCTALAVLGVAAAVAIVAAVFSIATGQPPLVEQRLHAVTIDGTRCVIATRGKDVQGISCDWRRR